MAMTAKEREQFIATIAPLAQKSQARTGVPASVTIAQAILESAWGRSQLSVQANNFFGIKARQGEEYVEFKTTEFRNGVPGIELAKFRKFATLQQCVDRHASLLSRAERYAPAMAAAGDPVMFAIQLQRCGYATDPKYPRKLTDLIERFSLTRFDAKEKA